MNVAFIGQKGIPMTFGGVEKHVERISVGLAEKGHHVFVYTRPWYTPANKKNYQGVKLISMPSIRTKNFDAITHTFYCTIDALRRDFDVIHYQGVGPALLAWIPRLLKPKTKVVVTFHSIDRLHQKWGFFARTMLRLGEWAAVKFADETITVSKTLQLYCKKSFNADTLYIPNGVDSVKPLLAKSIKEKFGLEKDGYFLFMSRLVRHKGVHYLIDAYKRLRTNKKLVIAGTGAFTDDYVQFLKKKAGKNPNIIFTGNIEGGSDIWREIFSNAYLFVHPSEYEGLPVVVLEAMSFGTPVLVSDIMENMEIIGAGQGFSFKNKSVTDLKNKLDKLRRSDKLTKKIGAIGQSHVLKEYNWKHICRATEVAYLNLLRETAHESAKNRVRAIAYKRV